MEVESVRRAKDLAEGRLEVALGEIQIMQRAKGDMTSVVEAATHNAEATLRTKQLEDQARHHAKEVESAQRERDGAEEMVQLVRQDLARMGERVEAAEGAKADAVAKATRLQRDMGKLKTQLSKLIRRHGAENDTYRQKVMQCDDQYREKE